MVAFGLKAEPKLVVRAKRLDIKTTPRELFSKFESEFDQTFLLESAKGESRLAEYSFIGFEPSKLISVKDGMVDLLDTVTGERAKMATREPFHELRRLVNSKHFTGPFRFIGGAVGFVSYDAIRYWEKLPHVANDDLHLPDLEFGLFNDGIVFDHASGQIFYYWIGENRLESVLLASKNDHQSGVVETTTPTSSIREEKFREMVVRAKEYIASGDIFQVVLSKRCEFELQGDWMKFYSALSRVNPSPYMYFLKFGEKRVIGSSPEMLARVEKGRVETFPIAGTRPHASNPNKNAQLTQELLSDPKERAEHVMLVDLARNDVGRVAKFGSVRVPELITVQQFSHVQHIVSHVIGDLRSEHDSFDALRALFPPGTVSGAPKPRAMEIIEELEPVRRGPYAGAVGYFSFNGNADFAITIRTLVADGKRCSIQTGAGIVADSSPEREWLETESKAAALMRSLEISSGARR
ncbi:MAG: anthranilate synthase component I [Thaumarchaeota archaeon]|nr:anthranilate synthase component I [Nitrososphaerota archaeon]